MDGWHLATLGCCCAFPEMVHAQDWLLHIGGATTAAYVASMNLLRRPFLFFSTDEVSDA